MKMSEWGEQNLINFVKKHFPPKGKIIGAGDDCAVIPNEKTTSSMLVTTDALTENVHFLTHFIKPENLGYKAIAVNVSDCAAMGGKPLYAFFSIALPSNTDCKWVKECILGIKQASKQFDLQVLGGDTVGSNSDIFINVTLIGKIKTSHIKFRHTAKPHDLICVTGYLGDSLAGFQAMKEKQTKSQASLDLIAAHVHPNVHLAEGIWLAARREIHAMMDISDGLDSDLNKLLQASRCGAKIDLKKIPLSLQLSKICQENHWNPLQIAAAGGEDYCLLLTVDATKFQILNRAFLKKFQRPLYAIGCITKGASKIKYIGEKGKRDLVLKTFQHFSNSH